jgi:hypothetical protein
LQTVDLSSFANGCYEYIEQPHAKRLALKSSVDYQDDIRLIAAGTPPERPTGAAPAILLLLTSVVGFMNILRCLYEGKAETYHSAFNRTHPAESETDFVVKRFNEIECLPKVGVAVAMNFFKDSQVPAMRGQTLDSLVSNEIGWYVKPDIHVLRFMLRATGRSQAAGVPDENLITLKGASAAKLYAEQPGTGRWLWDYRLHRTRPTAERGVWNCVEDVHRWAVIDSVAPLEIDRTLYLVGSGRYGTGKRVAMSPRERYSEVFSAMDDI